MWDGIKRIRVTVPGSATVTAPSTTAVPDKEWVRYCPECGRIGPLKAQEGNCCPAGLNAVMVPREVAQQARLGFQQMYPKGAWWGRGTE